MKYYGKGISADSAVMNQNVVSVKKIHVQGIGGLFARFPSFLSVCSALEDNF